MPFTANNRKAWILIALFCVAPIARTQHGPFEDDTRALASSGKIENNTYENAHAGFSVRLPQPSCEPKLNTRMDLNNGNVYLLECNHVVKGWAGMYTFLVFTDLWPAHPTLNSTEQYVRSMRHLAERDPNMKTVQSETARHFSGRDFSEMIVNNHVSEGTYYEGLSCTHHKAYLLCFKAEAPSVDLVKALLKLDGKLEFMSKTTNAH